MTYPTPLGKVYAVQNNNHVYAVARYVRTPAGNFIPEWHENVSFTEHSVAYNEARHFIEYREDVERSAGGWFSIIMFDLEKMLRVEIEARKNGYEDVNDYLDDAADDLRLRMDGHGFTVNKTDARQYVLDATGDVDYAESVLVEDWR